MMLNRLKEIDRQIKFVEQILKKEEYLAAGLTISVQVGEGEGPVEYINLGVFSLKEKETLESILEGLYNSRKYNVDFLRMDIQQASDYLNSTTKEDE